MGQEAVVNLRQVVDIVQQHAHKAPVMDGNECIND